MKWLLSVLVIVLLLVVGCGGDEPESAGSSLTVTGGEVEKVYEVKDLEALGNTQATFREVTYIGVPLATLLEDAGFDPAGASAVKAMASDGFSANYGPDLVNRPDTLVAYTQVNGPLTTEDGLFRMVLPDQEGKLNVRQLVTLQVIP